MTGRAPPHRPASLAVALSLATALWLPAPASAAREERTVAIAGHEMTIALAAGDCFFDSDRQTDRGLLDQLSGAAGSDFVVLLAFSGCQAVDTWRKANPPPVLPRVGYFMIAETHLEPVFAFDQQALADAIGQALKDRGVTDYRADVARLSRDLEASWKSLKAGERRELGIVHRDRYGPVLATVLAAPAAGGKVAARVMLHQSLLIAGKVVSVVAARDYKDVESIFDAYGELSATAEATASRN